MQADIIANRGYKLLYKMGGNAKVHLYTNGTIRHSAMTGDTQLFPGEGPSIHRCLLRSHVTPGWFHVCTLIGAGVYDGLVTELVGKPKHYHSHRQGRITQQAVHRNLCHLRSYFQYVKYLRGELVVRLMRKKKKHTKSTSN